MTSLLDTVRKDDAVEVRAYGTDAWTAATVVRVNRARRVVIVTVFGAPGTRSFPPDAVRRPPDFRPGELSKLRARRAVAAKPREQLVMKHVAHVVTVGRVKVQTMADQVTRDAIRAMAVRDGVTEGAVVRELLSLGFAAKHRSGGGIVGGA